MDDEINAALVNPLMPGVRLHAVIDACHSGSAMDLEFRCKVKQAGLNWKSEYSHRPKAYKVHISPLGVRPAASTASHGCCCIEKESVGQHLCNGQPVRFHLLDHLVQQQ